MFAFSGKTLIKNVIAVKCAADMKFAFTLLSGICQFDLCRAVPPHPHHNLTNKYREETCSFQNMDIHYYNSNRPLSKLCQHYCGIFCLN